MGVTISTLTRIAVEWGRRCFGMEHMINLNVRTLRFAEEAVELAQSLNVSREQMIKVIDAVYARQKGDPIQEVGGVVMTLAVLCTLFTHRSLESLMEEEVCRVLAHPPEHFAERNEEKIALGLDGK